MSEVKKVYKSIVFKHKVPRNANDPVGLFIEKIETIFFLQKTFLAVFVVNLAFAYG